MRSDLFPLIQLGWSAPARTTGAICSALNQTDKLILVDCVHACQHHAFLETCPTLLK